MCPGVAALVTADSTAFLDGIALAALFSKEAELYHPWQLVSTHAPARAHLLVLVLRK